MNNVCMGEKPFIVVIISNWVPIFKSFFNQYIQVFWEKLNINQFFKKKFTTRKPHNKLIEIDSKNQIWNNALHKDDIEKTFRD
jgi:hypothetical protein